MRRGGCELLLSDVFWLAYTYTTFSFSIKLFRLFLFFLSFFSQKGDRDYQSSPGLFPPRHTSSDKEA
jgi:hypothetical protein